MKTLLLPILFWHCEYRDNCLVIHTNDVKFYENSLFSGCLLNTGIHYKTEGIEYVVVFEQNCQGDSILNEIK